MNWIQFPRIEGTASRQAHADLPEHTYERELGREGLYGPATQMHHRHAPTGWLSVEGGLRPRAFDTRLIESLQQSPWDAALLFHNSSVRIRFVRLAGTLEHLVRNADGDDLIFVHEGDGELFCDYGHLAFKQGDYLLLPRGTLWRVTIEKPCAFLMIESTNDSFRLPEKGLVGNHAIFDPAVLDSPSIDQVFLAQQNENAWQVVVKSRNRLSTITYPFNPLDAVGWHGNLMPVRLNWRDIRPLTSHRYHLPPSVHSTFV
ncbi:MAG: homogentisate 1,2-dioxygenase, partial [Methylococcales bacterium]